MDSYDIMKIFYGTVEGYDMSEYYSKGAIEKAGKTLACNDSELSDEYWEARNIMQSWRAQHSDFVREVNELLASLFPKAVRSSRLKREESIIGKLKRFPEMSLYRMQDIGGCRVIFNSIEDVYSGIQLLKKSLGEIQIVREYDYMIKPKETGYRCYHIVLKKEKMLIELQMRTIMQHTWATAIEVMGIYTGMSIKTGVSTEFIDTYFKSVSMILKNVEEFIEIPKDWIQSLIKQERQHKILSKLSSMSIGLKETETLSTEDSKYFVLCLSKDSLKQTLIRGFSDDEYYKAVELYNTLEVYSQEDKDIVLVHADSVEDLRTAYPNYFVDVQSFVKCVTAIISNKDL